MIKNRYKIIATCLLFAVLIIAHYIFFSDIAPKDASNKNSVHIYKEYPELTAEIIKKMGGEEVVDGLISKYEENAELLKQAIQKYKESKYQDEKKPNIMYFIETAKYAQYLKKYDLSIEILENVFNFYDESDVALINLAHLYEEIGENQKAIDTYLRFYEMFDGVGPEQFYMDIMHNYIKLENKEKVAEYYKEYKKAGYESEQIEQYLNK